MPSVANAGNAPNRQRKSEAKTIRIEFARERRAFVIRISGVEFAAFQACASRAQPKGGSQLKSVLPSPPAHSENFFTYFCLRQPRHPERKRQSGSDRGTPSQ